MRWLSCVVSQVISWPFRVDKSVTSHKAAAPLLHYRAFLTGMPGRYTLIISPSSPQSSSTPCVDWLALPRPGV